MIRALIPLLAVALAVLAALIVAPAQAQDVAEWGGTGCRLIPVAGQPHVAEVHCRNVETSGNAYTEGAMSADGLTVGLSVMHGPGDVPDVFSFAAPDGYFADPPRLVLPEGGTGVALVMPWVGA